MTTYTDIYGLYNVKATINGNPSGNDGPIITVYARKMGLPIDVYAIQEYSRLLKRGANNIPLERLPGKTKPPPSRDTILGWYDLKVINLDDLIKNDWNFSPYPIPKFDLIETIKAFWRSRAKKYIFFGAEHAHRNHIWEGPGEPHTWRFAFSVPLSDRAYMLRDSKREVPFTYNIFEAWAKILPSSNSSALLKWHKYNINPPPKVFIEYFGATHPITLRYLWKDIMK